jgi:hypothetical protein
MGDGGQEWRARMQSLAAAPLDAVGTFEPESFARPRRGARVGWA